MTPTIKIKLLRPTAKVPAYKTAGAAGCDLYACLGEDTCAFPWGPPQLIHTGIAIELPEGWEAQVRPRSGLSKRGVLVHFGTIDSDYRGEVMVTMQATHDLVMINEGDRIAQLVFAPAPQARFEVVDKLSETERGSAGHGSTGLR